MNAVHEAIRAGAVGPPKRGEDGSVARDYLFGEDFIGFRGHFPGQPILPAILQILAAVTLLEDVAGTPLRLVRLESAKFHLPLGPGRPVTVSCRPRTLEGRPIQEGSLTSEGKLISSFLLDLAPGEPTA